MFIYIPDFNKGMKNMYWYDFKYKEPTEEKIKRIKNKSFSYFIVSFLIFFISAVIINIWG